LLLAGKTIQYSEKNIVYGTKMIKIQIVRIKDGREVINCVLM